MSCHSKPTARKVLDLFRDGTGLRISQEEWHELCNAGEAGSGVSRDRGRIKAVDAFDAEMTVRRLVSLLGLKPEEVSRVPMTDITERTLLGIQEMTRRFVAGKVVGVLPTYRRNMKNGTARDVLAACGMTKVNAKGQQVVAVSRHKGAGFRQVDANSPVAVAVEALQPVVAGLDIRGARSTSDTLLFSVLPEYMVRPDRAESDSVKVRVHARLDGTFDVWTFADRCGDNPNSKHHPFDGWNVVQWREGVSVEELADAVNEVSTSTFEVFSHSK